MPNHAESEPAPEIQKSTSQPFASPQLAPHASIKRSELAGEPHADLFQGVRVAAAAASPAADEAYNAMFDVMAEGDRVASAIRDVETPESVKKSGASYDAREEIVTEFSAFLALRSARVLDLTPGIPENARARLRKVTEVAAARVLEIGHWIHSRPSNGHMRETFTPAEASFNHASEQLGVRSTLARSAPKESESETREAHDEQDQVGAVKDDLILAVETTFEAKQAGIELFSDLSNLAKSSDVSFVETLAKAILVATAGHFAGQLTNALLASRFSAAEHHVLELLCDLVTDTVQSAAGDMISAASASAQDTTGLARLQAYFSAGLRAEIIASKASVVSKISALAASGLLRGQPRPQYSTHAKAQTKSLIASYSNRCAANFALYLAQSKHDRHMTKDEEGRHVTAVDENYFGRRTGDGEGRDRTTRKHAAGIWQTSFLIYDGGKLEHRASEVRGVNDDIAQAVWADAGQDIDRVWLPKEVVVQFENRDSYFVLDELGRVRDVNSWVSAERAGFRSPEHFWEQAKRLIKL